MHFFFVYASPILSNTHGWDNRMLHHFEKQFWPSLFPMQGLNIKELSSDINVTWVVVSESMEGGLNLS